MSFIRHESEYGWMNLPGHQEGALTKTLVASGETHSDEAVAGLNFDVSSYEPGAYVELHAHRETEEIFYIISGTGRAQIGDEVQTITAGTVMWVPPGTAHGITNTGTEPLKFIIVTNALDSTPWAERIIAAGPPAVR